MESAYSTQTTCLEWHIWHLFRDLLQPAQPGEALLGRQPHQGVAIGVILPARPLIEIDTCKLYGHNCIEVGRWILLQVCNMSVFCVGLCHRDLDHSVIFVSLSRKLFLF